MSTEMVNYLKHIMLHLFDCEFKWHSGSLLFFSMTNLEENKLFPRQDNARTCVSSAAHFNLVRLRVSRLFLPHWYDSLQRGCCRVYPPRECADCVVLTVKCVTAQHCVAHVSGRRCERIRRSSCVRPARVSELRDVRDSV